MATNNVQREMPGARAMHTRTRKGAEEASKMSVQAGAKRIWWWFRMIKKYEDNKGGKYNAIYFCTDKEIAKCEGDLNDVEQKMVVCKVVAVNGVNQVSKCVGNPILPDFFAKLDMEITIDSRKPWRQCENPGKKC